MIIDLQTLGEDGRDVTGEEPKELLELGPDDGIWPTGPLRYDIHVQAFAGEVLGRGSVTFPVASVCARCGDACAERLVDEPIEFDEEEKVLEARGVPADQLEGLPDGGRYVDLTPEIREASILALPSFPVCRADCRGVCPTCGANRNRKRCRCAPLRDTRWGGLDQLKVD